MERLYATGNPRGIRTDLVAKIERILSVLDTATEPQALNLPGYSLHALTGDKKGFWAVTVKANGESCSASRTVMPMTSS